MSETDWPRSSHGAADPRDADKELKKEQTWWKVVGTRELESGERKGAAGTGIFHERTLSTL